MTNKPEDNKETKSYSVGSLHERGGEHDRRREGSTKKGDVGQYSKAISYLMGSEEREIDLMIRSTTKDKKD
jgi:hypothetical protein